MEELASKIFNIHKACRICLNESKAMSSIYENKNDYESSIVELLQNYMSIHIEENEEFPSLICQECRIQVFAMCELKIKFEKSNVILQEYLAGTKQESIVEILEGCKKNVEIYLEKVDYTNICEDDDFIYIIQDSPNVDADIEEIEVDVSGGVKDDLLEKVGYTSATMCNEELVDDIIYQDSPGLDGDVEETEFVKNSAIKEGVLEKNHDPSASICKAEPAFKYVRNSRSVDDDIKDQNSVQKEVVETKKNYSCSNCKKSFNSKGTLIKHKKKYSHYVRPTVKCFKCNIKVPVSNYKSHLLKHLSNLNCRYCDKQFSTASNLRRHLLIHTRQKPYCCDFCGIQFARQDKLKEHRLLHTFNQPFNCTICGEEFDDELKLKQHQYESVCCSTPSNNVSEKYQRRLPCNICGKSFALVSSLVLHKLTHTNEGVICDFCGKPYPNECKLRSHKLKVHEQEKQKQGVRKEFLCNFCAKQYTSNFALQHHIRSSHFGITPKSHMCKICGKSFTQSGSLNAHLKIHTGERPFVCHICSRSFNKPCNLNRHLRCHAGMRPYSCPVCEKRFNVNYSLVVHMRIHTGEKPYACTICEKRFVDKGSLSKHFKIHTKLFKEPE